MNDKQVGAIVGSVIIILALFIICIVVPYFYNRSLEIKKDCEWLKSHVDGNTSLSVESLKLYVNKC